MPFECVVTGLSIDNSRISFLATEFGFSVFLGVFVWLCGLFLDFGDWSYVVWVCFFSCWVRSVGDVVKVVCWRVVYSTVFSRSSTKCLNLFMPSFQKSGVVTSRLTVLAISMGDMLLPAESAFLNLGTKFLPSSMYFW